MPYITVERGLFSDEQKEPLIKRLTEVSSEIMNVPQEFFEPRSRNCRTKILVLDGCLFVCCNKGLKILY